MIRGGGNKSTLQELLFLLTIASSCLILSCDANQAHPTLHHNALGALSLQRKTVVGIGSASRHVQDRNFAAFLPSGRSLGMQLDDLRSSGLTTLTKMFRKPPFSSSPCQSQRFRPRRKFGYSLTASDDDVSEGQQKGMREAFASLDALSPEDWNGYSNSEEEKDNTFNLKYSRTDDTPAADSGKSTEEEAGYYLEMQEDLEGTATPVDETENQLELSEFDEMGEEIHHEVSDNTDADEYPWTSINPILRLRGPVASGYGRGGKKLGVPTANLPASLFQSALEDVTNGVYFGWAVIEQQPQPAEIATAIKGRNVSHKAVVNVGYSPTFEGKENKEKIVEAHLITESSPMEKPDSSGYVTDDVEGPFDNDTDEIEGDFYDETMRLQLIGYLRPEQKFESFPDLIAQIHRDIGNANLALDTMPFIFSKEDEFVKNGVDWVGMDGGDISSSWEFESW